MKAMILAAGRGERMRPLTVSSPKPLLEAGGKALIVRHLERLVTAGIVDIVINHAWLGGRIEAALGDGRSFGARIAYSAEAVALETAGGIAQALPLLGDQPFLVINGDIHCEWDCNRAHSIADRLAGSDALAWLVLVPNPAHHPHGDFRLAAGRVQDGDGSDATLTFSGIAVYRPQLFAALVRGAAARLAPLLRAQMPAAAILGERFDGAWADIGTPARLRELDRQLRGASTAGPA